MISKKNKKSSTLSICETLKCWSYLKPLWLKLLNYTTLLPVWAFFLSGVFVHLNNYIRQVASQYTVSFLSIEWFRR